VDPANTTPMVKLQPLLERQPYIKEVVIRQDWSIEQEAPRRPISPTIDNYAGHWIHLGYPDWPKLPLPFYTAALAGFSRDGVDWSPWITAPKAFERQPSEDVVLFHWSDRWFELKLGLTELVRQALPLTAWSLRTDPNSARWHVYKHARGATFDNLARQIASVSLVVTDCSAVHVLAAAIGTPCVVVEPEEARHHPIFWPGSVQDEHGHWKQADNHFGKLIWPVIGGDGKPSFDARHTADLIMEVLARA
jgi:hypothetical protein